jgi:hypothetical protein
MTGRLFSKLECLDESVLRCWIAVLCAYLIAPPGVAIAQTSCSGYGSCAALQVASSNLLTGNISYSFDDAALAAAFGNDQAKIQDFKTRMTTAASDWAQKTGRNINGPRPAKRGT